MCFGGGQAQATINDGNVYNSTAQQDAKYAIAPDDTPPGAVDLSDPTLQAARQSAKLRAAMGYNRQSTFLTGPNGDTAAPKLGTPTVLGGG